VIVLDTSVLVYAVGADHPYREPCLRLLAGAPSRRLTTTATVIQEFVHVRQRRGSRADAVDLGRAYLDLLSPLLEVPDLAVGDALDLLVEHPGLGAFDAVLAAAATRARCTALVTADKAFSGLRGCRVVTPDDGGVDQLLR
jgi:predicted nucleic acid-binding protein